MLAVSGTPAWLSGPVAGVTPALQPVAHALLEVRADAGSVLASAAEAELWIRPGGAASVGFHIRHLAGSIDRLMTYARGESLSSAQLATLADEKAPGARIEAVELRALFEQTLGRALVQLRDTREAELDLPRAVGRQRLPSTVRGLLCHAAEHSARHCGQAITTLKILRGMATERPRTADSSRS